VILNQFHGDFSHEPLIEDWASWAKPFVIASIGATHVSADTSINFTRISFGIGGGISLYAGRHLGVKIQAEWLPVFANPHVAFICGSGCIVHVGGTLSSQGEVFAGPILRF
jgi:CHASE2 domain-containing sensor protein